MVYLVGLSGLILGFFFGQMVLAHRLRGYSKAEIFDMLKNRDLKWKYGLFNWGMALAGAICSICIYKIYFP